MIFDEDTGEDVGCPFCGSTADCKHLVALIDEGCQGGAFSCHELEFHDRIDQAFLTAYQAGIRNVDPQGEFTLHALWQAACKAFDGGEEFGVSAENSLLLSLLTELMIDADAVEPAGYPVSDDGPGQSAAYTIFYSEDPERTVNLLFDFVGGGLERLFGHREPDICIPLDYG